MTKIKICGVTLADDAAAVAAIPGVDYIGLNFWPKSKRYLDPERAPLVAGVARGNDQDGTLVKLVGVFVDARHDDIVAIANQIQLDAIQLHGDESPAFVAHLANALQRPVWRAVGVAGEDDLEGLAVIPSDTIVLDAPSAGRGGSGMTFDWALAAAARQKYPGRRFVLAGGLTPENVGAAIAACQPWCVDVASGVETAPGVKDAAKVAAFVAAVKGAQA